MNCPSVLSLPSELLRAALRSAAASGLALLAFAAPAPAQIRFTDVADEVGVGRFTYFSPTSHSLGVNWIDFDRDGFPDLFVVGGDASFPPRLFHNLGDGTFTGAQELLPNLPAVEMTGSIFADYDRDGDLDLYIYTDNDRWRTKQTTNPPDGPLNLLLKNLWSENGGRVIEGQPLFVEVAQAAGIEDSADPAFGNLPGWRAKSAAWFDYDRDGCVDLYVGHLVLNAGGDEANRDRLYRNRCDGTFEDALEQAGLSPGTDLTRLRAALAVGGFHLNDDLWPDLYVVNASYVDENPHSNDFLFLSQGPDASGQVTFEDLTLTASQLGDDAQGGMGVDVADVDLDGDWDLYISDILVSEADSLPLGNVFYLGDGKGGFQDNSAPSAGIAGDNSWGVNFFDADLDGLEDLYISTIEPVTGGPEFFYRNDTDAGGVSFTNIAKSAGIATLNSRGSAVADYDRDGDLDLAVVNQRGPLQLFRNDSVRRGGWLMIELLPTASSLDGIGTLIEVEDSDGVVRRRQIKGGSSAHSQDWLHAHFGLGEAAGIEEVRVFWPSGAISRLRDVPLNAVIEVAEGEVCRPSETTVCLLDSKFEVSAELTDFGTPPAVRPGKVLNFGGTRAETEDSVFFESFSPGNFELAVKILDGCGFPPTSPLRNFWVFVGGLTNARAAIEIEDLATGERWEWNNSSGVPASATRDFQAFSCDAPAAEACSADSKSSCLQSGRFKVSGWMESQGASALVAPVRVPLRVMSFEAERAISREAVFFDAFSPGNFEIAVKVLDACQLPPEQPLRGYWVFYGGLTDAQAEVTVRQVATGVVDRWTNAAGNAAVTEIRIPVFSCED